LAAVTVSARRWGLPQHRGQRPEPAKRRRRLSCRPCVLLTRARAFGVTQSSLCTVRGLGILVGDALAQTIGGPLAVSLADLVGVTAATMLTMSWTYLRGRLIMAQRGEAEARAPRSVAC